MTGIDVAIRHGFHSMTQSDMAATCKAMLDARPVCRFDGIKAGKAYCYAESYTSATFLVAVGSVTPAKTQALANVNGDTRRIYRGNGAVNSSS